MSDADTLKKRFEDLIKFITESTDMVQNNAMPELGDLDANVTALCKDVEGADPEVAKEIQPLMGEMITKLDTLENELKSFHDRTGGKMS